MTETGRIADLLEQTFEGKAYYGNSVLESLTGITAETASRKPALGKNSIWDLVRHLTAELEYHVRIIEGNAEPWVAGETTWSEARDRSEAAWLSALEDLKKANRSLVAALRKMPDECLETQAFPLKYTLYRSLHGTLQHSVYHAGQIILLRKQAHHQVKNDVSEIEY
jgi:uncharacterized damage-inducible protein DinB